MLAMNLQADHSVCGTAKFCNEKPGNANLPIGVSSHTIQEIAVPAQQNQTLLRPFWSDGWTPPGISNRGVPVYSL